MHKKLPIYDAHFHILDPQYSQSVQQTDSPISFSVEDYRARMADYRVIGGTFVATSAQSDRQTIMRTLETLGDGFVGVIPANPAITDTEIRALSAIGVRGIRFNGFNEDTAEWQYLPDLAARVYEVAKWHVELSVDARELSPWVSTISQLPRVCIDHLGRCDEGFKYITQLIERDVYIKASGFGRLDFNVKAALINLYSINPKRLMFGSDLPSTSAPMPYSDKDYELIVDTLGENKAKDVLYQNALDLYCTDKGESTLGTPPSNNSMVTTTDFRNFKLHKTNTQKFSLQKFSLKRFLL